VSFETRSNDMYSNPIAPGDAADDGKTSTFATNDDFRKLLTAKPMRATTTTTGGGGGRGHGGRKKSGGGRGRGGGKKTAGAKEDDGGGYRDRAKERREREDAEGEEEEDAGVGLAGNRPTRGVFERDGGGASGRGEAEDDKEYARLKSIEESKYLGGDVERTHLVKGLDFALLRKVRGDIADEEVMRMEEEARAATTEDADVGKTPKFKTTAARALHEFVMKKGVKAKKSKVHPFAAGSVSYSFDLSAKSKRDVPMTLHKSQDDDGMAGVRALRAYVDPGKDASLLQRLGKLMHYLALGSTKAIKKFRRDERRAAEEAKAAERAKAEAEAKAKAAREAPAGDVSSDEDIFADVGKDYEPTVAPKEPSNTEEKTKSFFGDGRAGGEASAPAPKAKTIAADDYVEDEEDDRPANAFGVFGDYDECYPGYDDEMDNAQRPFDKKGQGEAGDDKDRERKDQIRKKRQIGNEFSKIRSMMTEKFGGKDDIAFEGEKKSKKAKK